jgi:protein-tyrosine phosphatase
MGGTSLGLDRAPNARDLGGYVNAEGLTVREGVVLRAEALNQLTEDDVTALAAVRTIVDYRGHGEIEAAGEDRLPAEAAYAHLPVFAPDYDIYLTLVPLIVSNDPVQQHEVLGDGGAERIMISLYRWFVSDATAREAFAETLRLISDPEARPVLFHCTAGKDRTGWMAAVLLTALGVHHETVVADYLLTNERQAPLIDMFKGPASTIDPALIAPLLDVRPQYLQAAFDQVKQDFGTFPAFLRDGLGADEETLRKALLG